MTGFLRIMIDWLKTIEILLIFAPKDYRKKFTLIPLAFLLPGFFYHNFYKFCQKFSQKKTWSSDLVGFLSDMNLKMCLFHWIYIAGFIWFCCYKVSNYCNFCKFFAIFHFFPENSNMLCKKNLSLISYNFRGCRWFTYVVFLLIIFLFRKECLFFYHKVKNAQYWAFLHVIVKRVDDIMTDGAKRNSQQIQSLNKEK